MSAKKVTAWFLTDAGKQFSFLLAGTVTTSVAVLNFLPHTILIDYYKDFTSLYRNGLSVPLPKPLQDRFQKALDLVNVDRIDKHLYKPFSAYGFDIFSAGSGYSRFGVIVGLPANFAYGSVKDVDKSKIKVNQESVVWESDEGQQLLKSLVLSENAQLYAMAREIEYRQTAKPFLDVAFASSACLMTYSLSNSLNTKLNYYAKPLAVRLTLYAIVASLSLGFYWTSKDMLQIYYEQRIDKDLKARNKVFADGGKEFYEKMLERNKSLRKLLGKEGEKMYSVLGNENYFLRSKHLPIVQRKSLFEEQQSL